MIFVRRMREISRPFLISMSWMRKPRPQSMLLDENETKIIKRTKAESAKRES